MTKSPKRVVVIEDDIAMREILTQKLVKSGFQVLIAEDGLSGLALIERERPDIILMDILMPGIDGYEVLRRLRAHKDKRLAEIPVFILSNLWSNEDKLKASQFHIKDYLIKAYLTPDQIVQKLKVAI